MAGKKGKGKSPRYSDRYGANRPNPYTGYLPPGSAPAGQLYHPESVNMEKVSQMMTENASNLAAAAASRVVSDTEVKGTMDNENAKERPSAANESVTSSRNGGQQANSGRQQRERSKHRKGSGSGQNTPAGSISDEQRQRLQEIQEEAAAEMVADVLTESIIGAAEMGRSAADAQPAKALPEADESDTADDTDWGNMRITTKFRRGGGKRSEQPFDPDRFDDAEVFENPFDANYFSDDEEAARFVPPLEIFDTDSEYVSDEDEDTAEDEDISEDDSFAEEEDIAEDEESPEEEEIADGEISDEDETAGEEDDFANEDEIAEDEDISDGEDIESEEAFSDDEDAVQEDDIAGEEDTIADEEDPAEDESLDDEDDIPEEDEDDPFGGVDWETPDDTDSDDGDDEDEADAEDEDDDDMIIVDDAQPGVQTETLAASQPTHSILRVSADSRDDDDSDHEQDDTLFIRQERVNGGTEVFNLPEGVKLPTYIDDDEFLEQWLNEGEDMAIKDKRLRRRVSTIIGTVTMLFAMVGFVWVIQYAFGAIAGIGNTDETKERYTDFIAPVVMSEVQPFESWSAIPSEKLLQSAIFHVLTNMDESYYQTDDTNKIVIPSGDVENAVKELYGDDALLSADALDVLDSDDAYYSDTDDCFHVAATGISGPQPEIISISKKGSEVTLLVGYLDETGLASTEEYYLTAQFVLEVNGDDICIRAIRAAETEK